MLWLQLTAFVVLLGADLDAELEHQTLADTTTGVERPLGMADPVGATAEELRARADA